MNVDQSSLIYQNEDLADLEETDPLKEWYSNYKVKQNALLDSPIRSKAKNLTFTRGNEDGNFINKLPIVMIQEMLDSLHADNEFMSTVTEKPRYFKVSATIMNIISSNDGQSLFYTSCPTCKKKVMQNPITKNSYDCTNCDKILKNCNYNYNFSVNICDISHGIYVQFLGDTGDQILEMTASNMCAMEENNKYIYENQIGNLTNNSVRALIESKKGVSG